MLRDPARDRKIDDQGEKPSDWHKPLGAGPPFLLHDTQIAKTLPNLFWCGAIGVGSGGDLRFLARNPVSEMVMRHLSGACTVDFQIG